MSGSVVGLAEAPLAAAHHLPCSIQHSGPAPVSSYFAVERAQDGSLSSTFRGRGLAASGRGEGVEGALLELVGEEERRSLEREAAAAAAAELASSAPVDPFAPPTLPPPPPAWRAKVRFERFDDWVVAGNDVEAAPLRRALGWLPIAEGAAAAVGEQDVLRELGEADKETKTQA